MAREYFLNLNGTDDHGQPNPNFNAGYRQGRDLDTLLGFCRGIAADGKVTAEEILALHDWIKSHPDLRATFPVPQIVNRIERIYSDGCVDETECEDFRILLEAATGAAKGPTAPTELPLDTPPPPVDFENKKFCLTGKFCAGTREWCKQQVERRFGIYDEAVRSGTDFLVIGTLASRDWKHTSHGTKITKALELKAHRELYIISEEHWSRFL